MKTPVHFSIRSSFSLGESTLSIEKAVEQAAEAGYRSLALVDVMTISGLPDFFKACRKHDIKPIIGATVRVVDDPQKRKVAKGEAPNREYWLKVLVRNDNGLKSLMKLLTTGGSENNFYYKARVGIEDVQKLEDVFVMTGDMYSLFSHPDYEDLLTRLTTTQTVVTEYVQEENPLWQTMNIRAMQSAHKHNLMMIVSNPALYSKDEQGALDVMKAVSQNNKLSDPWVPKVFVDSFFVRDAKTATEGLTTDVVGLIKSNDDDIANACHYEFKKLDPCLPLMTNDDNKALAALCMQGFKKRFDQEVMGHKPDDLKPYGERLKYEIGVIKQLGFANYFLLVADIVTWAKGSDIYVGPGRGSIGGSLVAYLVGITDVDPIRFGLIFERFINPDRIDLPDADLDFMSTRRVEVIDYLVGKFGADRVAGISNFNSLGAASALRDTSRVYGLLPYQYSCSKEIENVHGVNQTLEEARNAVSNIDKFANDHPEIWSTAVSLQGVMRTLGKHAAGVVVAGEPIVNRAVIETRGGSPIINWDKRTVEDFGLIKMDILGLTTLDVLRKAVEFHEERSGEVIDLLKVPLDDVKVLEAFSEGHTAAIFQFESSGMKDILRRLATNEPLTFDDLVATTALYRPGPLDSGMTEEFIQVKLGEREPYYEHDLMEDSLSETNGIMLYQESVMQVARDIAGYTLAEADLLRKVMGKKDPVGMANQKDKWVKGCIATVGFNDYQSEQLFSKIETFASYGFNKSHSVEYTILSYWAMYLKVRHPSEFFAAVLTVQDNDDKTLAAIRDAKEADVNVYPPHINISSQRVEIDTEGDLYAPFQSIRGISEKVASYIVASRKLMTDGIKNHEDLKVGAEAAGYKGKINVAHFRNLEAVGAFADVTEGSLPATDTSRLKDQLTLMPGFTIGTVKVDRVVALTKTDKEELLDVVKGVSACKGCSLLDNDHPKQMLGKNANIMIVQDAPAFPEGKAKKMFVGDGADFLKAALADEGIDLQDLYVTSLVKAVKDKGSKVLTNDQVNGCSEWLDREVSLIRPPIILTLGLASAKHFVPSIKTMKGLIGKTVYLPKLDASIVFGINPVQCIFNPSKVDELIKVAKAVKSLQ